MYRVYTKEQISKEIFNVNLDTVELQQVMGGDVFKDHPELERDDYIIVQQENAFEYPTYRTEDNIIEEMTREEKILILNKTELLQDGEYIEENKIKTIEKPEDLLRAVWNREEHTWSEGMTAEEVTKLRSEKILKYAELEENKKALEDSKFSSTDEIALIVEEMSKLEEEINSLAEKINALKV